MLLARIRCTFRQWRADRRGVAALEFALLAPILSLIFVSMVDIGIALNERMAIDSTLRMGAATAMAKPAETDEDTVRNAMQQAAQGSFTTVNKLANATNPLSCNPTAVRTAATLTVCAERFCACPTAKGTVVACTATCSGSTPLAFFNLAAGKRYTKRFAPLNLPDIITLSAALKVQVK